MRSTCERRLGTQLLVNLIHSDGDTGELPSHCSRRLEHTRILVPWCDGSLLERFIARKNHMNQGENHNMTSDAVSKDKTWEAGHD